MKQLLQKALILLTASAFAACAAFQKDNTPLISAVEDHLVPENQPAKTLAAPLYLTAGVVGGIIDVFIYHPVSQIPEAFSDTRDVLFDINAGYYTDWGSLPVRFGFSPVFFSFVWLARSTIYAGDSYIEDPAGEEPHTKEELLKIDDPDDLRPFLDQCTYRSHTENDAYSPDLYIGLYRKFAAKEPEIREQILRCMSFSEWNSAADKKAYESFLVSELGDLKLDSLIIHELQRIRSVAGSKRMLDLLESENLDARQIQNYINGIINIDHTPHINELKRRLRGR